ncbi:hypothetical protein SDC49_06120 [Lactobacillus sp. R2/2]|nr:hypothetical protein [Lactobacillus sp. R2/2]
MIFGYVGSGEEESADRNYYQEWEHAGDLFNTQGSLHDGDYNYYGFSISHNNNICSLHFISVPTYIVKVKNTTLGLSLKKSSVVDGLLLLSLISLTR